ncbi:hypothetical protein GCM10007420_04590 [Glycocaulis albus]|uniref:Uncharacterized protein n=1 Tax=Glycocaulis albus TaxID=1382801 RepID=A0ABQ1XEN5_9PROT|nr:hypothetical protein [Glycocaulis albus]GGG92316.1 hypothetical protein GCM10007420_04590 [Glycocaulis albus]
MTALRLNTWFHSQAIIWPHPLVRAIPLIFGAASLVLFAAFVSTLLVFVVEQQGHAGSDIYRLPFILLALASLMFTVLNIGRLGGAEKLDAPHIVVAYFIAFPAAGFCILLQTLYRIS